MDRYTKFIRIGIVVTLLLIFVLSVLPGLLLEPVVRNHYYSGLLLGGCIVLITALLAREW